MTMGTLYLTHSSRSCCSRSLDLCTIWLTAKGAAGLSGWAWLYSSSSRVMRCSHCSNTSTGRALSEGKESTTPALHCASTRSGLEMMNSGEPTTGLDRRPLSRSGRDMRTPESGRGNRICNQLHKLASSAVRLQSGALPCTAPRSTEPAHDRLLQLCGDEYQ